MSREINFPGKDVARELKKYMGSKAYNKLIERRFYQYEKIKKAVWEAKNDKGTGNIGDNGRGHVFVSDPTANAAIRATMPIPWVTIEVGKNEIEKVIDPEKWLSIISATYQYYEGGIVESLLKYKYKGESYQQICLKLHISSSTYYQLLSESQQFALSCACQVGVVRMF